MPVAIVKRFLRPAKPHLLRAYGRFRYLVDWPNRRAAAADYAGDVTPRILVCDDTEPAWDQHAGGARMSVIVDLLQARGTVTFCPLRAHDDSKYANALVNAGVRVTGFSRLRSALANGRFDLAVVSRAEVGDEIIPLVKKYSPSTRIIFDTVDIGSIRSQREYEITGDKRWSRLAWRLAEQEVRSASLADEVWCVTEVDSQFLRDRIPGIRTRVVPTIHDARKTAVPSFDSRADMVFVGSQHRPNVDAVDFFCREVMPLLRRDLPGITFNIVGSMSRDAVLRHEAADIRARGFIPDLQNFLDRQRVLVCPLRYGSGMKGKIGEAMAAGLPVVTTSIGAEGMALEHGRTAMIADDPAEIARCIVNAYSNQELWSALSQQGMRHVDQHYSSSVVDRQIQRMFEDLRIPARSDASV